MTSVRLRGVSRTLGLNPRRRGARGAAPVSIVQDGLVAEWRFDDGAGQVLTDHAGGHHGQLGSTAGSDANDPAWTAAGLSFDGANDYVYTTDWAFPSPDFHVDVVGRFNSVSLGGGTDFVATFGTTRTGAADDDTSPLILFREGNTASIRIRIGNGTTNVLSNAGGIVFDDQWHHLSIDYDGSQLTLAVDGVDALVQNIGLTPNTITASTLFGIWHNLVLLPASVTLGYVTVYEGVLSSEQKAQQSAALAAIMAARGITLP
jgi:Concanavalin A-like lectin/glucanases superfamily